MERPDVNNIFFPPQRSMHKDATAMYNPYSSEDIDKLNAIRDKTDPTAEDMLEKIKEIPLKLREGTEDKTVEDIRAAIKKVVSVFVKDTSDKKPTKNSKTVMALVDNSVSFEATPQSKGAKDLEEMFDTMQANRKKSA